MKSGEALPAADPPVAVGYVRAIRPDAILLDAVAERLREYGARAGFTVGTVLRDDTPRDRAGADAGFLTLLEEIRTHGAQAVVIPAPSHLSLLPDVRRWMVRMLKDAGVQLIVVPTAAYPTNWATSSRL